MLLTVWFFIWSWELPWNNVHERLHAQAHRRLDTERNRVLPIRQSFYSFPEHNSSELKQFLDRPDPDRADYDFP